MSADRSDLEPVLDDDGDMSPALTPAPRRTSGRSVVVVIVVLALLGMALVSQRQREEAESSLRGAQDELRAAQDARAQAELDVKAAAIAEAERERARKRAEEAEQFDATAGHFVLRDPIVVLPPDLRLCRAVDLVVFHHEGPGAGVALTNRSGRPCGLPNYPILQGLDEGGRWRTVPVQQSPASSYTDGPEWTGVLVPGLVAVLAVGQPAPLQSGTCRTGSAPTEEFSGPRYVLGPQTEPLVVQGRTWSVGPCRPEILLWAYDHTGA